MLGLLKNPSYAGMYVFGRYRYRREISPEGKVHQRMHAVAMPDWRVSLKEHHEGYITWEELLKNQERLEKNRPNGEETLLAGPARQGLALLQGLLLCGHCGRRLTVRYLGNGGIYPCYLCNWLRRDGLASKDCMSFHCDLLDAAVSEEVLKALQPVELELALAALAELEARDQALWRQRQMRLERAEYEAALAERRYLEVDPSQRLVASTLERRWNDALLHLEDLKKQAAEFQRQEARVATSEQKAKVLALAKDLPRVWHAPTTRAQDRKRMFCGCSSRILPSTSPAITSSSWFTSAGRVKPRPTSRCNSRPASPTGCGIRLRWWIEFENWLKAYPMRRSRTGSIEKDMPVPRVNRTPHRLCGGFVGAIRFRLRR